MKCSNTQRQKVFVRAERFKYGGTLMVNVMCLC